MDLNLNYDGFEDSLVKGYPKDKYSGVQYVFKFDNNYGASVVKFDGRYGYNEDLWELAVIWSEDPKNDIWHVTYDTPITDDVIGWLTNDKVKEILQDIKELKEVSDD